MLLQARDPIPALKSYLLEHGVLNEGAIKDIEAEVVAVVEDAVKFADESPKPVRARSRCPLCCTPQLPLAGHPSDLAPATQD